MKLKNGNVFPGSVGDLWLDALSRGDATTVNVRRQQTLGQEDRQEEQSRSGSSSEGSQSSISNSVSGIPMDLLELQEELYGREMGEDDELEKDVIDSIKRALKKIFRDVKFPSTSGTSFEKPNFVHPYYTDEDNNRHEIQAVTICEIILKRLSKYQFYFFIYIVGDVTQPKIL